MKKFNIITAFILLFSANLLAQYSTDWIRPADNNQKTGAMIARDNSDNVIATGYWTSYNIFTRKYNKFGVLQWENMSASGIAGNYERSVWVNTDNSNNVFVVGYRYTGTSLQYPNAVVVLKYSATGTLLWKNTISMTISVTSSISFNLRSEVDNNGNLYIGTVATSPSGFVLIKLDPNGTTLFTSSNNLNAVTMFNSMRLKGNKIVMTGSSGNLSLAPLIAWDTTGALLWTAGVLGRAGHDVEIDDGGNVYLLSGYDNQVTATSGMDIEIYKFNPAGTQLWKNDFDFGGSDFPTRFIFVADKLSVIGYGNIGASYFDWITFQLNTAGTMLWNTRYNETSGNDEQSYFIAAKANGDVFVTGKGGPMFTLFGSSYLRMITLKYDSTGVRKWIDSVNIYSGWGLACTLDSDSNLFVLSGTNMTVFHFLDHTGTVPPAVPAGLNVSNIGNTSATFTWTPVSNAYLYHLRYKTTAETTWTIASINIPSITITGLSASTSYNYACEAISNGGPSGYSATQTFTTGIVLPINGLEIMARRQGENVLISWSTQSEQNSAWFDVERSYNGIDFTKIGRVNAAGYSSNVRNYGFTDVNAAKSLIFYRLKLVDADGSYKLSLIRVVTKSDGNKHEFLLYPNPAVLNVSIVLNEAATEDMQLQVTNQMGQIVKTTRLSKGTQLIKLDISKLPKGIYAVKLTDSKIVQINKLLIQ